MNKIVSKFGGSSLATPKQIKKVVAIIQSNPERQHIVVSAPGIGGKYRTRITNQLRSAGKEYSDEKFLLLIGGVIKRFEDIVKYFGLKKIKMHNEWTQINQDCYKPTGKLDYDFIVSRGEYLMAKILAEILGFEFIDPYDFLQLNENGSFNGDLVEATKAHKGRRTVTAGFYGIAHSGYHGLMSQGASDTSGAIVASAVNASLYEIWTDVSGICMAHPRIVENPRILKEITHEEMRELSYMGAEVIHEEALFPVQDANIPTKVLNTNYPNDLGTLIVQKDQKTPDPTSPVTGIAGKKGFSILCLKKRRMNKEVGYVLKLLKVLADYEISFDTLPSGIDTLSLMIETNQIKKRDALLSDIINSCSPNSSVIEDGLAILSVVGVGMISTPGVLSRVSKSLFKVGVNIRNISQEDGEMSIIIGIDEDDCEKSIRAIYNEFA